MKNKKTKKVPKRALFSLRRLTSKILQKMV